MPSDAEEMARELFDSGKDPDETHQILKEHGFDVCRITVKGYAVAHKKNITGLPTMCMH